MSAATCRRCGLAVVWSPADMAWHAPDAAPRVELICEGVDDDAVAHVVSLADELAKGGA